MDKQRVTRNMMFVGVCAVGVGLGFGYIKAILHVDPFARFAHKQPPGESVMATVHDVDLVRYHKDQLIAKAHVGEMDIRHDHETYDLRNVHNGMMITDQGKIMFDADAATWNSVRLYLQVNSGAHVSNDDFDLRVPSFTLDQNSGLLMAPKQIRGRFFGGQIAANNFVYNVNTKDGKVGPVLWMGKAKLQDDTGSDNNTKWTFQANGAVFSHADTETWNNATATDGDVIVQADQILRNKKTDVITATGNCLYWSKKADMACDKVVIYRKEKRAVLTSNVRMLIKPKEEMEKQIKADKGEIPVFHPQVPASVAANAPLQGESQSDKDLDDEVRSGKTTRKYPTVVLASNIEYWYGKGNRHATITGEPQASQSLAGDRWRRVWATTAHYDGEGDTITLERGDKAEVQMKNSMGDDILAKSFKFSTQEDNDDWWGDGVHGDVMGESTEDNPNSGSTNPPPPTKNPPPLKGNINEAAPKKSDAEPKKGG